MKIGTNEIPDFRLSTTVLSDLKKIYEKFGLSEVDQSVVAQVLDHKSEKSGTFLRKIASMRDYALIEARGKVKITATGELLADPTKSDKDYNEGLIRAVNAIPLWRTLFDKYTKKGLEILSEDFWLDLKEFCDLTIEQAKNQAPTVLSAFKEDIKQIRINRNLEPEREQKMMRETQSQKTDSKEPALDMEKLYSITLASGEQIVLLKENPVKSWNRIQKIAQAYIDADFPESVPVKVDRTKKEDA